MVGHYAQAGDYSVSVEHRAMDNGWSFLPAAPASFQSVSDSKLTVTAEFENFRLVVGRSDFDMQLQRSVEPKDVSLSATEDFFSIFYKVSDDKKLGLSVIRQLADQQRFECYDFSGITLGPCQSGAIQLDGTNDKYDVLEGDLVGISAETISIGLSFQQQLDWVWLDDFTVGVFSTTHDYDWLTPIEDLASPFILGLKFNGKTLGDAITESFDKFPQRDSWRLHQVNISASKALPIYREIEVFSKADVVYLHYSNYRAIIEAPNYDIKLKVGLRLATRSFLYEVYGNYYQHNLIGFEPITFNQKTEHYFNRPYGNVGIKLEWRF